MKRLYTLLFLLNISLLTIQAQNFTGNLMFSANLDGTQETPPVSTQATGIAGFTLNSTHDTLCVNVSVIGLSGSITGAHLHLGPEGIAGPVWVDLSSFIFGNRIIGTIASPADSTLEMLMKGLLYINVHTAANPAGEIRGQIYLESEILLTATLDGAQEVPPIITPAYGYASFKLSKSLNRMTIHAIFSGLTDSITGIHLHNGAVGISGPVVEDLMTGLTANSLTLEVNPTSYLNDLLSGNIYINVHTATNPNGEIRGQVILNPNLSFYFIMSGAEETPPNAAPGMAIGNVWISPAMDSLFYYIAADTLTSPITGAHLHLGAPGTAGPILVPLMGSGNTLMGFVTDTSITLNLIRQMLEGMVYANVHSTNFPSGELRGQLHRIAREGFSYEINGNNEVPPVPTNATGFGVASLDDEGESLYYSLVVSGLNSALVSGHFHNGPDGQNGPILFTLNTLTNNFNGAQAMGFWTSEDSLTPFTQVEAALLFTDSVYVNLHTATWPSGEARGQLTKGGLCSGISVSINDGDSNQPTIVAFPNPVSETLNLDVTAVISGESVLRIYDLTGREIVSKSLKLNNGVNNYQIDVSNFEGGAYLIQLLVNEFEVFEEFVKD